MTILAIAPSVETAAGSIELRCPDALHGDCDAGKLLAKIRLSGERPTFVHPENLIELACDHCKAVRRRQGTPVRRVLHRYDLLGELIETLIIEQ
jgi:hypothetical protein